MSIDGQPNHWMVLGHQAPGDKCLGGRGEEQPKATQSSGQFHVAVKQKPVDTGARLLGSFL